jgi:hypothetical protein
MPATDDGLAYFGLDGVRVEDEPFEAGHEADFQQFIETHPRVLPIRELNPRASVAVPIGREVETDVGNIDLVFLDDTGCLFFVECKLVANPEARRVVVAQLLEYRSHFRRDADQIMTSARKYEKEESLPDVVKRLRAASTKPLDLDHDTLKRRIDAGLKTQTRSPMLVIMSDRLEQRALVLADALRRLKLPIACVEVRRVRVGSGCVGIGSVRAASLLVTLSSGARLAIDEETWIGLVDSEPLYSIRVSLLAWAKKLHQQGCCDVVFGSKELGLVVKSPQGNQKLVAISDERFWLHLIGFLRLGWSNEEVEQVRRAVEDAIGAGHLLRKKQFGFRLERLKDPGRLEKVTQVLGSYIDRAASRLKHSQSHPLGHRGATEV